jgi:hypothetical protein
VQPHRRAGRVTAAGRFVGRVRRRLAVAVAVESVAIAFGWSGAVTWPVLVALRWTDRPMGWLAVATAVVAVTCATLRFQRRCPTRLEAAAAADRRFGWDDLLSTAVTTDHAADPFAAAANAVADGRCRDARSSDVPVARLGRFARLGVGVTLAAWAAAATLPLHTASRQPAVAEPDALAALVDDARPASTVVASVARPARPSPFNPSDETQIRTEMADTETDVNPPGTAAPPDGRPSDAGGSRAGRGRSGSRHLQPESTPDEPAVARSSEATHADGAPAAGAGPSLVARSRNADQSTDGPGGAPASKVATTPPSGWPAARADADAAVRAGTVPPRDRSLVTAYFTADAPGR